ncbi:MAG: cysteine desulfurase [Clostridia bacterium]|nr:cysteine desulfurase [Clostridia bacterium]
MIYLDNSATTKQYDEVTEAMLQYMKQDFGNPSALYQLGVDAEKAVRNARAKVLDAAFGGRTSDWDVVFTSGGTEADNMAIFSAARAMKRAGNRIVTTKVEHPAVLECCRRLEEEGFEVIRAGVDAKCRLNMDELENAINENTILVTMMHVNNEIGTVMPVDSVKEIMKKKKAPGLFHCDAVQSFGKMQLPKGADLISVSGHKIHGPKGSGALLIRKGKTAAGTNINLPAFILGGGQESGRRSGTENVPAIIGLGTAAEMAGAGMAGSDGKYTDIGELGQMREKLKTGLEANIEDIIINTPMGESCPTVLSVSFMGCRGEVLLHTLEQNEIYVSTGSACSSNKKGQSHVLEAMGLKSKQIEGTLRFSLGRFNTEDEIDICIEKVTAAVKRFRKLGTFR